MNEIVPMPQGDIVAGSPAEVSQFIRMALAGGTPAADIKTLFEVYERMVGDSRKTQFDRAMTKFQAEIPPMPRGHKSQFSRVNAAGVEVRARYSDMADIASTIAPCLRANGLSYDWEDTELIEMGGQLCYRAHMRIRHESGYSERKSGPPIPMGQPVRRKDGTDVQSAPIHATAVITTAQRLCLRSAFGLYSIDQDEEDAAAAQVDVITGEQVTTLIGLLSEYNVLKGDGATDELEKKMLAALGVGKIGDIPAEKFEYVRTKLAASVKAAGAK